MTNLDSIHQSINELQRLVGGLVQANRNAESQRRTMFEKHDQTMAELRHFRQELVALRHEHNSLQEHVDEMRPDVADYRRMKQRGIGVLAAVAALAGGAGAALARFIGINLPGGGD
jgi:ferric-dicitrate binding protein FerR (iron transport regulator)